MGVQELAARIEQDHIRFEEECKALKMSLETSKLDAAEWKIEFILKLRDFQHHLVRHFDLEEEVGFLSDVVRLAPHFSGKADGLALEHRATVLALEVLVDEVKRTEPFDSGAARDLCRRVEDLLSGIVKLERTEQALLQDIYNQDYGVGD